MNLKLNMSYGKAFLFEALHEDAFLSFPDNCVPGISGTLVFVQDAIGGHSVTIDDKYKTIGDTKFLYIKDQPHSITVVAFFVDTPGSVVLSKPIPVTDSLLTSIMDGSIIINSD